MITLTHLIGPHHSTLIVTTVKSVRADDPTNGFANWFYEPTRPWNRGARLVHDIPFSELDDINRLVFVRYAKGSNKIRPLWHAACSNPSDRAAWEALESQVWSMINNEAITEHRRRKTEEKRKARAAREPVEVVLIDDWVDHRNLPSRIDGLPDGEPRSLIRAVDAVVHTPPFDMWSEPWNRIEEAVGSDDPVANCRTFLHELIGQMDHWFANEHAVQRSLSALFVLRGAAPLRHGPSRAKVEKGEDAPVGWDQAQPFLTRFRSGDEAVFVFQEFLKAQGGRKSPERDALVKSFAEGQTRSQTDTRLRQMGKDLVNPYRTLRRSLRSWMEIQ